MAALKQLSIESSPRPTVEQSESPRPAATVVPPPPEQAKTRLGAEVPPPVDFVDAASPDFSEAELSPADPSEVDYLSARREFWPHLMSFVAVIGGLGFMNLLTSDYPWFLWVALAWGMGLLFHLRNAVFGKILASPGRWAISSKTFRPM